MVYYVIKGKQKIETASGDHVVETKWRRLGDIAKCTETVCAGPGGHSENLEAQKYFSGLMGLLHPSLVYTVSLYIILYIIYELSQKLKTGYHSENQFWNPGFTNGFTQFCGYRYFCYEILFYLVSSYFTIFSNLLNKNLHKF